MIHVFVLYVFLGVGEDRRLISKDMYFRDLKECTSRGAEFCAKKLYMKHSTTEAKIKAANEIYQLMETSQYKRAVTMWKKK